MDDKKQFSRRLLAIGVLFSLVLAAYFVTLFDAQIVHGAEYRARSIRANTKSETVVTSRGILTDRNGKALVTNRSVYTLELDTSLAPSDDAALNKELLRLIELLENRGIVWEDTLPLTAGAPFTYDFSVSGSHTALNSYLVSKKWADEDTLTTDTDPPLSPEALLSRLRTEFKVDGELTDAEARKLVGLRYCLAVTEAQPALDGGHRVGHFRGADRGAEGRRVRAHPHRHLVRARVPDRRGGAHSRPRHEDPAREME